MLGVKRVLIENIPRQGTASFLRTYREASNSFLTIFCMQHRKQDCCSRCGGGIRAAAIYFSKSSKAAGIGFISIHYKPFSFERQLRVASVRDRIVMGGNDKLDSLVFKRIKKVQDVVFCIFVQSS